jgi:adenine-specific DNA-methyltransferase
MAKKTTTTKAKSKKVTNGADRIRVETITHDEAKRKNIPTAELQSIMQKTDQTPIQVAYARRNRDLDPQLVWRGKDSQDWSDLVVSAPPLYIQEKVHPKVLIDDLIKTSEKPAPEDEQINLFSDFNGLPNEGAKTEFYQHDSHWSNRMILGDSLQVMASLAEREGLRGKVQCIYLDPPYGIKFNSNFQWSTTSRDVKDGKTDHITREPEQVKAFRDTWRDGIHSYLTYLRDRLTVARDLLADSGSIFVQIGEENIHRVRALMDEVFGESNFCREIYYTTTSFQADNVLANTVNMLLWFCKNKDNIKVRQLFGPKDLGDAKAQEYKWILLPDGTTRPLTENEVTGKDSIPIGAKAWRHGPLTSQGQSAEGSKPYNFRGKNYSIGDNQHWKTSADGLRRLDKADLLQSRKNSLSYFMFLDDFPVTPMTNVWLDTKWGFDASEKCYVVQTNSKVVTRCIQMASDPGDLILDPTCGSGTTAMVAEQWGRRWITIDTSRVALTLARSRIMGARYPYYLLADSLEGQKKEAEITHSTPSTRLVGGNVRHGFVYERVPHITMGAIAKNLEIDVIWDRWQSKLEEAREAFNKAIKGNFQDWDIPRSPQATWSDAIKKLHSNFWAIREARRLEINASIANKAEFENLYDRPYIDRNIARVAGPFTVESVSPHKVLAVDSDDSLIRDNDNLPKEMSGAQDFATVILENLKSAGVQQAHKEDKISFTTIIFWPGKMICAEGVYIEGKSKKEKRAAIFIGPEFGTVSKPDLVEAAKEAADSDFEVLISCAFNYDAMASDFQTLGRIPILKARMNADLHMADDLKNTGKGNLFVIFGEPDIEIKKLKGSQIQVKINGVDVFHPNTGEVKSDGADGIACWFIDTDYNEESFFVRHAYFLGANDPYKALKTSLKAEIDQDAWDSLNSDISRPFDKPESGRIAVKVINHLGDEVMKVFKVE